MSGVALAPLHASLPIPQVCPEQGSDDCENRSHVRGNHQIRKLTLRMSSEREFQLPESPVAAALLLLFLRAADSNRNLAAKLEEFLKVMKNHLGKT